MSLDSLCRTLRYEFQQPEFLIEALTHRSSDQQSDQQHNERLEFLGDAVLGMVVSDALFHQFPEGDEGDLTRAKSLIVSREALARQAQKINLGRYIIMGAGEERSGGRHRKSILSNAYEALIGAMYLDGGIAPVEALIEREMLSCQDASIMEKFHCNYKSWLLEHVQGLGQSSLAYKVVHETGPDHHKLFTIQVFVNGCPMGEGGGLSKKKAEQSAARDALQKLGILSGETKGS